MRLPLRISGERGTEIMRRVVEEAVDDFERRVLSAYPDQTMPGLRKLSAGESFARMVIGTQPADFPLLQDEEYVEHYRLGLVPPPVSPLWLNLLSIPSLFKEQQRNFLRWYRQRVTDASIQ